MPIKKISGGLLSCKEDKHDVKWLCLLSNLFEFRLYQPALPKKTTRRGGFLFSVDNVYSVISTTGAPSVS
jgi:hypothetical protein